MDTSTRALGYDLFKLIVAILLLILFFILLWRPTDRPFAPEPTSVAPTIASTLSMTPGSNPVAVVAPATSATQDSTSAPLPSPTTTREPALKTSLPDPTTTEPSAPTLTSLPPPTATDPGAFIPTPLPSPTATNPEAFTPTPLPTPTGTATIAPTPDTEPAALTACEAVTSHSQLQPGMNATIVRRLNFRSSPGIKDNWLRTNIPGTRVEVIGGPECVPHIAGAYMWWQVRLSDGEIGWSAEGSIHGTFYFMEPAQ